MMQYITNAGIILAGCLIFYKILLQKETFFRANRWILLVCLALSFGLPLVQVPQEWSFRKARTVMAEPAAEQPALDNITITPQEPAPAVNTTPASTTTNNTREMKAPLITWQQALQWAGWLYWFGVIVFAINFLVQLITLLYRAYTRPVIRDGRFRIVELTGDKAPCSFWNNIFINPEKYDWETYSQIIEHEKVHIQQRHSFDLLLAELVIVFQWFNPFAWQYRKTLENNLEYLTDDQLVNHHQVEKEAYQMSLLKVSAPHFPLNLTTNYNQSLLKKRIAMMNVKKSNLHTAWKYCFLLPLLVFLVCLLNEPVVYANAPAVTEKKTPDHNPDQLNMETEGVWFATIKENKVSIQFRNDEDEHSTNSSTFTLSELGELPKDKAGVFTVTREAGSMQFSGRFEGDQGMGRYKFTPNNEYAEAMKKEGIEIRHDKDVMTFFLVNVNRAYVKMLKDNGYTELRRNDVIPMAALKIDEAYIKSIRSSGIKDISMRNLIPFKSLKIDGDYIAEIRKAGYPDVTANQLISFKSQGIDAKYIADVRSATGIPEKPGASKESKPKAGNKNEDAGLDKDFNTKVNIDAKTNVNVDVSPNDIIAIKALNITPEYIRSLKEVGLDDLRNSQLVSMKSQNITAEYVKELKAAGFQDLSPNQIVSFKALNVTPEYARSLKATGLEDLSPNKLVSMKSQGITAEYIKSLQNSGFKDISANDIISIKAQNITPEYVKSFEALGYKDIKPRQVIPLKSLNVTPEYIKGFQDMGFKDFSLNQAVSLKAQNITPALIKEYTALGFENVSINEVISAKSTGTTPAFINSMKQKGHNLKSIQKYIQLKTIVD